MPHLMPTAVVEGDITLRPWSEDDVDALVRRINDADIAAFLDLVPQPYTRADAHDWLALSAEGWRNGTSATFGIHADGLEGAVGGVVVHAAAAVDHHGHGGDAGLVGVEEMDEHPRQMQAE